MKEHHYGILKRLIVKNNIWVNQEELKLQLISHPSYPSLHALTGVLNHFNIDNLALRLPVNTATLAQLPGFFIAAISEDADEKLVLVETKSTGVKITDDKNSVRTITHDAFLKIWNGIILAVEQTENIKHSRLHQNFSSLKKVLLGIGLFLMSYFVFLHADIFSFSHFLLSLSGFILSVLVLKHELGLASPVANQFCNLSTNASCDAVLNSKGATLFGVFKLSDLSLVFFASSILTWFLFFINGITNYSLFILLILMTIPGIIYTIYYQYQVIKRWCPLCLSIAAVLLLQYSILPLADWSNLSLIHLSSIGFFLATVLITIAVWSLLKPLLKQVNTLTKLEVEHYRFKRKFSIFNMLHQSGDHLRSMTSIPGEIVLGNQNAPIEIILVTNPLCYYCKQAHRDLEQILKTLQNKVKVIIRVTVNTPVETAIDYQIANHLLAIYKTKGSIACQEALSIIYRESTDLQQWLDEQKRNLDFSYEPILKAQQNWYKANAINFTPALFINGRPLPKEYDSSDLIYFIEDLAAQTQLEESSETNQLLAS